MKTCKSIFQNKTFSEPLMLHLWPSHQLSNSENGKLPIQKMKSVTSHMNNFRLLHLVSCFIFPTKLYYISSHSLHYLPLHLPCFPFHFLNLLVLLPLFCLTSLPECCK